MPIFGAKSRAERGCASKLACGHRIGPLGSYEFALGFLSGVLRTAKPLSQALWACQLPFQGRFFSLPPLGEVPR